MLNKRYKLSICIPTYNQASSVEKLLETLSPQYISDIEVIVLDDSPGDDTERVVSKFKNAINIRYFHGERRGLDAALLFLTEQANGDFIWWIGDDLLYPNAIMEVLSVINNYPNLTFMWVNSASISDPEQLAVIDIHSRLFNDRNDILNIDIGLLGFITATIFKREIAITGFSEARRHIGSAFVCMYIILHVISQEGQFYYLGNPCFASHPKPPGEVRWYDQTQVFGINLFRIVYDFKESFNRRALRSAIAKNLRMVLKAIVVERAMGLTTGFASGNSRIIPLARIYWSYWDFILFSPLLLLPTPVLKTAYQAYIKIRNIISNKK